MAYKYDSHLSLKSGVSYFVKRVPSDLIHHYRSSRISYSLRTRSVRLASARARVAADKLDDYWYHLRVQTAEIPALHLLHEKPESSVVGIWVCREGSLLLATLKDNLKSILASCIALLTNMPLTHIVGCSFTANDSNQVSDF